MIDLSNEPRARAFRFEGGEYGCLLLHGFTGTPAEVHSVGEFLARRGHAVLAPLLPGHGLRVEDLARTRWEDWFGAALEAWAELGLAVKTRVVLGLSMGALLALHLAHQRPQEVSAVAALAPALRLRNQQAAEQSLWLSRIRLPRSLAFVRKDGAIPPELVRQTPNYDQIPIKALASMIRLQRIVRGELPAVQAPTLIVEGGQDRTVAPQAGAEVERLLGSSHKRRIIFPDRGHILTEEPGAEEVLGAIESFFAKSLAAIPLGSSQPPSTRENG